MSYLKSRSILLALFVFFFVVSFTFLAVFYVRSDPLTIDKEEIVDLLAKVVSLYFIHLSIIITGYFGQARLREGTPQPSLFWAALSLSIIWNLMFIWRLIYFCLSTTDDIPSIESYISKVTMLSSFLVTGALAYFFTADAAKGNAP